jgi:hypothetical protein
MPPLPDQPTVFQEQDGVRYLRQGLVVSDHDNRPVAPEPICQLANTVCSLAGSSAEVLSSRTITGTYAPESRANSSFFRHLCVFAAHGFPHPSLLLLWFQEQVGEQ